MSSSKRTEVATTSGTTIGVTNEQILNNETALVTTEWVAGAVAFVGSKFHDLKVQSAKEFLTLNKKMKDFLCYVLAN